MMEKRIPTLVALLVLVVGVAGGVFLVQRNSVLRLQASIDQTPQNISISNVTSSSFTVSWTTQEATHGSIKWGTDPNSLSNSSLIMDESSTTHYIEVNNLSASTQYYFDIYVNSKLYPADNSPFVVETGRDIPPKPISEIATGTIITSTDLKVANAIVYLKISGGNTISDLTSQDGVWLMPLSSMRSKDLSNYLRIDNEDVLEIFVDAGPLGTGTAKIKAINSDVIPEIVLGSNLDFTNNKIEFTDEIPDATLNNQSSEVRSSFDFLSD